MKGIRELLEGLIPYTQRHYSRIDRLVRGTFLLDYTLTGLSVLEQEIQQTETNVNSLLHSQNNQADEERVIEEQDHSPENAASKKRKIKKSKQSSHKKMKGVSYTKVGPIEGKA